VPTVINVIDVVLPCLDEAEALPWVLSRMPDGYRPIVADNGSRDGSPELAARLGATVVVAGPRGFGATAHARIGNAVVAWRLRQLAGVADRDLGPMRAARRIDLLDLGLVDRRYGHPLEMVLRAGRAGWRVREVDVGYAPRAGGRSKVTGTLSGTVRTVKDMTRVLAR
jgi:hypothetical protein